MNRRVGILALVALIAVPFTAVAQQPNKVWRIGVLETIPLAQNRIYFGAFKQGMLDLGYVEGKNYIIEYRSGDGSSDRFPELAAELVRLKVDIIVSRGTPATQALKGATTTIPIVTTAISDPRLVGASLARPGGNITGLVALNTELQGKRVELLKEILPRAAKHRLPSIYNSREFVVDGGLISFGVNYPDQYRRAAGYVDKIFKGAQPGDLPMEQPTRFDMAINLKTAKALGITIPQSVMLRADEVIQ